MTQFKTKEIKITTEQLIREHELFDEDDKQYQLDILPSMSEDMEQRLRDIMTGYIDKIASVNMNYEKQIIDLNKKHLIEWEEMKRITRD